MKKTHAMLAITTVIILTAAAAPQAFAADTQAAPSQSPQGSWEMRLGRRLDRKEQRMERRHSFMEEHAGELTEEEKNILKTHREEMMKERQARREAWHKELQEKHPALWAKMQNWFPKMTDNNQNK